MFLEFSIGLDRGWFSFLIVVDQPSVVPEGPDIDLQWTYYETH